LLPRYATVISDSKKIYHEKKSEKKIDGGAPRHFLTAAAAS
jgi:hypothetical protein